jgi:CheY-like chemotaxis protein
MTSIAVVDNDIHVLGLLTDLLHNGDRVVRTCWNGEKAFAFVKDEQPDLVLLDLWLDAPTSGWHVLRDLKLEPQTCNIPVVLLSEHGDPVRTNEAWLSELGVVVVPKPFDVDVLCQAVEAALNGGAATTP